MRSVSKRPVWATCKFQASFSYIPSHCLQTERQDSSICCNTYPMFFDGFSKILLTNGYLAFVLHIVNWWLNSIGLSKMKRQPCVNGHSPSLLPSPGRALSPVQKSFCLPWGEWKTVAIPWALPLESKHCGRESNPTPGLCFYRHFLRLLSHVSLFLVLSIFYTNFPKTWTPLSLRWCLRRLIPAQLSPFRTSWWALILSAF